MTTQERLDERLREIETALESAHDLVCEEQGFIEVGAAKGRQHTSTRLVVAAVERIDSALAALAGLREDLASGVLLSREEADKIHHGIHSSKPGDLGAAVLLLESHMKWRGRG